MCRFTFYMGDPVSLASLITEPENSLINQSIRAREREEPLNGDGFGVVWYVPGHESPARFRSVSPAWSNQNLAELARVTSSNCVLAHVRAATQNLEVSEANCHPFRWGRFAFMHNGDIKEFSNIRRPLIERLSDEAFGLIRGNTDSEHLFALVVDHLNRLQGESTCEALAEALNSSISEILEILHSHASEAFVLLNLVLTDGKNAVATRFSTDPNSIESLYINSGTHYHCDDDGVCHVLNKKGDAQAVLVSSEPLNSDQGWQAVPKNHMALISEDLQIDIRAIEV